jgi:hypothetical protein
MKKVGFLLTSSAVVKAVDEFLIRPLKDDLVPFISVNDKILDYIRSGKRDEARNLVAGEIRNFKEKGVLNVIFTCSSISCFKDIAIDEGVVIYAIDDFLEKETRAFGEIAFLATVPSALAGSASLFGQYKNVNNILIENAFNSLLAGNRKKHDKIIVDRISALPDDLPCIVLAQISMMSALAVVPSNKKGRVFSGAMALVKNLSGRKEPNRIRILDSISYVKKTDEKEFVISGSHGGTPSVKYAIDNGLFGAVFNDAGVGKNKAGISGLAALNDAGIPGMTVSAGSAEIGNGRDTYDSGVVSHLNDWARYFGAQEGMRIKDFIASLISGTSTDFFDEYQ